MDGQTHTLLSARMTSFCFRNGKNVDINAWNMRYFFCEVGLAMCHSTGSIGDTLIGPFYYPENHPSLMSSAARYGYNCAPFRNTNLFYKLLVTNLIPM